MATAKTVWVSDTGMQFDTEEEAVYHEAHNAMVAQLNAFFTEATGEQEFDVNAAAAWVLEHFEAKVPE
jgi:hypothetical protein